MFNFRSFVHCQPRPRIIKFTFVFCRKHRNPQSHPTANCSNRMIFSIFSFCIHPFNRPTHTMYCRRRDYGATCCRRLKSRHSTTRTRRGESFNGPFASTVCCKLNADGRRGCQWQTVVSCREPSFWNATSFRASIGCARATGKGCLLRMVRRRVVCIQIERRTLCGRRWST